MKKAFTLIELLIVVAIIAILAAIAVPNFLEAQVRAKVSRAKSDLRTLTTSIEAYAVDNNKYPFDWDSRGYPWKITDIISTPIAYVTAGSNLLDIFRTQINPQDAARYRYINFPGNETPALPPCPFPGPFLTRWDLTDYTAASKTSEVTWGSWKLSSAGPDKIPNTSFFSGDLPYDPTNGTISEGDIIRSQKTNQR
jgi:prepilin-type N-terminal cleavage/methylation domain-containing protein